MFCLLSVSSEVSQHQCDLSPAIIPFLLTAEGVSPGLCFLADVAVTWCDFFFLLCWTLQIYKHVFILAKFFLLSVSCPSVSLSLCLPPPVCKADHTLWKQTPIQSKYVDLLWPINSHPTLPGMCGHPGVMLAETSKVFSIVTPSFSSVSCGWSNVSGQATNICPWSLILFSKSAILFLVADWYCLHIVFEEQRTVTWSQVDCVSVGWAGDTEPIVWLTTLALGGKLLITGCGRVRGTDFQATTFFKLMDMH